MRFSNRRFLPAFLLLVCVITLGSVVVAQVGPGGANSAAAPAAGGAGAAGGATPGAGGPNRGATTSSSQRSANPASPQPGGANLRGSTNAGVGTSPRGNAGAFGGANSGVIDRSGNRLGVNGRSTFNSTTPGARPSGTFNRSNQTPASSLANPNDGPGGNVDASLNPRPDPRQNDASTNPRGFDASTGTNFTGSSNNPSAGGTFTAGTSSTAGTQSTVNGRIDDPNSVNSVRPTARPAFIDNTPDPSNVRSANSYRPNNDSFNDPDATLNNRAATNAMNGNIGAGNPGVVTPGPIGFVPSTTTNSSANESSNLDPATLMFGGRRAFDSRAKFDASRRDNMIDDPAAQPDTTGEAAANNSSSESVPSETISATPLSTSSAALEDAANSAAANQAAAAASANVRAAINAAVRTDSLGRPVPVLQRDPTGRIDAVEIPTGRAAGFRAGIKSATDSASATGGVLNNSASPSAALAANAASAGVAPNGAVAGLGSAAATASGIDNATSPTRNTQMYQPLFYQGYYWAPATNNGWQYWDGVQWQVYRQPPVAR